MENVRIFKVWAHPTGHVPGAEDIDWGYWVAWDTVLEVVIAQDDTKRGVLRELERLERARDDADARERLIRQFEEEREGRLL